MAVEYNENTFVIDLIASQYNTTNPRLIQARCKEDLDTTVSMVDIMNYLDIDNNEETKDRYSLSIKDIF